MGIAIIAVLLIAGAVYIRNAVPEETAKVSGILLNYADGSQRVVSNRQLSLIDSATGNQVSSIGVVLSLIPHYEGEISSFELSTTIEFEVGFSSGWYPLAVRNLYASGTYLPSDQSTAIYSEPLIDAYELEQGIINIVGYGDHNIILHSPQQLTVTLYMNDGSTQYVQGWIDDYYWQISVY